MYKELKISRVLVPERVLILESATKRRTSPPCLHHLPKSTPVLPVSMKAPVQASRSVSAWQSCWEEKSGLKVNMEKEARSLSQYRSRKRYYKMEMSSITQTTFYDRQVKSHPDQAPCPLHLLPIMRTPINVCY